MKKQYSRLFVFDSTALLLTSARNTLAPTMLLLEPDSMGKSTTPLVDYY